jgi:N utilization substance protein B
MLYQWEVGRAAVDDTIASYWAHGQEDTPGARRFADDLVRGTVARLDEIDPIIAAAAEHWRLSRMAVLDRLILRLAVYEFLAARDTPPRVVINEALELAKIFSADESVGFINGVLDGILRRLQAGAGGGGSPAR